MKRNIAYVSVITIVKNNDTLIPRAIDSVLSQTLLNFEYIIVNDGSTDNTKEIIDSYYKIDDRVKPIHLEKNVGRSMARNVGLDAAMGRFIFFLDSDDHLPKNALENLYIVADKHDADIVYGGIKCFSNITGEMRHNHYNEKIINRECHNIQLENHLDLVDNHLILGRLYNRDFIKANNISFSKKRKNGEDVLFAFYTAYYAKRISMVPDIIAYNYSIGNYLSTANESKLFDARDNLLESIDFVYKYGSKKLRERMSRKGALFSANLERAERVYNNQSENMGRYIATLQPLVERCTINIIQLLPEYEKNFVITLLKGDFAKAYRLWNKKNNLSKKNSLNSIKEKDEHILRALKRFGMESQEQTYIIKRLESLKIENRKLAYQLDELYRSNCWRITAPLRNRLKKFKKCLGLAQK